MYPESVCGEFRICYNIFHGVWRLGYILVEVVLL